VKGVSPSAKSENTNFYLSKEEIKKKKRKIITMKLFDSLIF
jgi:hypothetical protein